MAADSRFSKARRLLTSSQYKRVFSGARKVSCRHITLLSRKNDGGVARLGLVVPKKAFRRAVWRNRIKRQAREVFRQHQESLKGLDLVLIARGSLHAMSNKNIQQVLLKNFQATIK